MGALELTRLSGVFRRVKGAEAKDKEEFNMELLEQCQKWFEHGEHKKIIDALEAIADEDRTADMDMELA